MRVQSKEVQLFKTSFHLLFPDARSPKIARPFHSGITTTFHPTSQGTLLIAEDSGRSLARVIAARPCEESFASSHHWLDELPRDGTSIDVSRRGKLIDFVTQNGSQSRVLSLLAQIPATSWAAPVMDSVGAGFIDALAAAAELCQSDASSRLLKNFQLDSKRGTVTAQNGCETICYGKFKFPWRHPVELKSSDVFASLNVDSSEPVLCGVLGREIFIFAGPWRLRLPLTLETPAIDIDQEKRELGRASNRILFDPDDLAFVATHCEQNSERLRPRQQVSLILGDRVEAEVMGSDDSAPKRLILSRSTQKGRPVTIHVESRYLLQIAKLGLNQVCWHADEERLSSRDERRLYIFNSAPASRTFGSRTDFVEIDSANGSPVLV